jgi:hypothetical protein
MLCARPSKSSTEHPARSGPPAPTGRQGVSSTAAPRQPAVKPARDRADIQQMAHGLLLRLWRRGILPFASVNPIGLAAVLAVLATAGWVQSDEPGGARREVGGGNSTTIVER